MLPQNVECDNVTIIQYVSSSRPTDLDTRLCPRTAVHHAWSLFKWIWRQPCDRWHRPTGCSGEGQTPNALYDWLAWPEVCMSDCLSKWMSVCPSVDLFLYLSVCLSAHLSLCLFASDVSPSVHPSHCRSVFLSICFVLSVSLSFCLSFCVSLSISVLLFFVIILPSCSQAFSFLN